MCHCAVNETACLEAQIGARGPAQPPALPLRQGLRRAASTASMAAMRRSSCAAASARSVSFAARACGSAYVHAGKGVAGMHAASHFHGSLWPHQQTDRIVSHITLPTPLSLTVTCQQQYKPSCAREAMAQKERRTPLALSSAIARSIPTRAFALCAISAAATSSATVSACAMQPQTNACA